LAGLLPSNTENISKPSIDNSIDLTLSKNIQLNLLSNRADVIIQNI
jgi:hypothetical protein